MLTKLLACCSGDVAIQAHAVIQMPFCCARRIQDLEKPSFNFFPKGFLAVCIEMSAEILKQGGPEIIFGYSEGVGYQDFPQAFAKYKQEAVLGIQIKDILIYSGCRVLLWVVANVILHLDIGLEPSFSFCEYMPVLMSEGNFSTIYFFLTTADPCATLYTIPSGLLDLSEGLQGEGYRGIREIFLLKIYMPPLDSGSLNSNIKQQYKI